MTRPLTHVVLRSVVVLLVLGLVGVVGTGLAGSGPWSALADHTGELIGLWDRLVSGIGWLR